MFAPPECLPFWGGATHHCSRRPRTRHGPWSPLIHHGCPKPRIYHGRLNSLPRSLRLYVLSLALVSQSLPCWSAPPWWAPVSSAPPWWAPVSSAPPWWAPVSSAPPWWAPVSSAPHGPGPPSPPPIPPPSWIVLRSLGGGLCHESGSWAHAHSPHCLLHLSTAAHHTWTAFPIHHCTSHTAVTDHSLALTVYTPYLD